jgi:hypothetical protein
MATLFHTCSGKIKVCYLKKENQMLFMSLSISLAIFIGSVLLLGLILDKYSTENND